MFRVTVVARPESAGHAAKDGRVRARAHSPLEDLPNVAVQGWGFHAFQGSAF